MRGQLGNIVGEALLLCGVCLAVLSCVAIGNRAVMADLTPADPIAVDFLCSSCSGCTYHNGP